MDAKYIQNIHGRSQVIPEFLKTKTNMWNSKVEMGEESNREYIAENDKTLCLCEKKHADKTFKGPNTTDVQHNNDNEACMRLQSQTSFHITRHQTSFTTERV